MTLLTRTQFAAFGFFVLLCTLSRPALADEASLWQALRGGDAFAIMRHAIAPGTGDPAEVVVGDCTTQRNLSAEGRDQAATIGDRFRANGISAATVFTSEWCRCRDTAEGLALGTVVALPALNSFFGHYERQAPQTAALKQWLSAYRDSRPLVLVTHQVNITALTGVYPASGETIVVQRTTDGSMTVLGRLP